ncbi:hypothetical protein JCGZ_18378 [Jatropha curcas]|uniref:Aminotransferase-like plant mobile domain-containing protein n=1 Tax=Jatropha curcas TaxID=180498 RepID=A0A067K4R5_JATCU|nr:hypothetical protein JCGZ_18378 [Jatropha curcas]
MSGPVVAVWAYEYRIYPGGPSGDTLAESRRIPRYLAHCHHTYASGEDPEYWRSFLNDKELSDDLSGPQGGGAAYPIKVSDAGVLADRYFLGERVYDTPVAPSQRRVPHAPPRHMCLLEGLTREDLEVEYRGFSANDFLSWRFPCLFLLSDAGSASRDPRERKTHKTVAHYRVEAVAEAGATVAPARPAGIIPGDVPFPPGMEVVLDPDLGWGRASLFLLTSGGLLRYCNWTLSMPHTYLLRDTWRFARGSALLGFTSPSSTPSGMSGYDLEIGRLRRHQSRQSSAVSRLQAEVDRLRTRLEVKGIPLDSSDEDADGSSDDTPPSPPPQAAAGPSRRQQ